MRVIDKRSQPIVKKLSRSRKVKNVIENLGLSLGAQNSKKSSAKLKNQLNQEKIPRL